MSVNLFGLTAAGLRKHMFPQWNDFSTTSSPDSTTVGEIIEGQAGELAAKLYAENVTASSIAATTDAGGLHSPAFLWCLETLRLMVALRVLRVAVQGDPELTKTYAVELATRLKDLDGRGSTALGDSTLDTGPSEAGGPATHISEYSLTTLAATDMSPLDDVLRRSDKL